MSFKVHLLIIACIIIAVLLAWQFLPASSISSKESAPAKPSYSLSITHASWGLNCSNLAINSGAPQRDAFLNKPDSNSKLHEDNVLGPVALLCNGNNQCDISLDEATLGADPAPNCTNKMLEIEYRCFSYDRPWTVKASSGPVSLHCDQPPK